MILDVGKFKTGEVKVLSGTNLIKASVGHKDQKKLKTAPILTKKKRLGCSSKLQSHVVEQNCIERTLLSCGLSSTAWVAKDCHTLTDIISSTTKKLLAATYAVSLEDVWQKCELDFVVWSKNLWAALSMVVVLSKRG